MHRRLKRSSIPRQKRQLREANAEVLFRPIFRSGRTNYLDVGPPIPTRPIHPNGTHGLLEYDRRWLRCCIDTRWNYRPLDSGVYGAPCVVNCVRVDWAASSRLFCPVLAGYAHAVTDACWRDGAPRSLGVDRRVVDLLVVGLHRVGLRTVCRPPFVRYRHSFCGEAPTRSPALRSTGFTVHRSYRASVVPCVSRDHHAFEGTRSQWTAGVEASIPGPYRFGRPTPPATGSVKASGKACPVGHPML